MNRNSFWAPWIAAGALVVLIVGGILGFGYVKGLTKADGGSVIVVRNGGMFDDNGFRQIVTTSDGLTQVGLWSQEHPYPTTQRYFKVSADGSGDSNEQINVPTKDGVLVGVEGTFFFELNQDPGILEQFDNAFGTRTFPNAKGDQVHAWDEDGWSPFLSATLGNLVQNVLRQEVGKVECKDLVASCSLAQNAPTGGAAAAIDPNVDSNSTLVTIQDAVNKTFAADVQTQLGIPLFVNVSFAMSKISLPQNVQDSINNAQSSVADANGKVATAQAAQAQAAAEAQANVNRQNGYNACPICGQIDIMKSLPQGITVYAPGSNYAVTNH